MRRALRLVVITVLVALTASSCTTRPGRGGTFSVHALGITKPGQVYPIKDRLPAGDYRGTLLRGGAFRLAASRGHVTVLSWWASWCGPCQVEMPQYDVLSRRLRAAGVQFVGFDIKDSRSAARAFVSTNHISFPIVYDERGASSLDLGVGTISGPPYTMLIDAQGRVAAVYVGSQADVSLNAAIAQL